METRYKRLRTPAAVRIRFFGPALTAVLVGLLSSGCIALSSRQTLLPGPTPIPNPVVGGGPGMNQAAPPTAGSFRDASIQVGQSATPQMFAAAPGSTALAILQLSTFPAASILHAQPADYDMRTHQFVRFEGVSKGCRTSLTIPVPGRGRNDSRFVVPVHFEFALRSFYDDLEEQMARHRVVGLFDSRLDREETMVLFGLFGRSCYRFRAIGIQEM